MTPVGYAWMPILDEQIVRGDENALAVSLYLPENYMYVESTGMGKSVGPDVKWADGKGQKIFKVNTKLVSTIYSQVCKYISFVYLNKRCCVLARF